MPSRHLEHVKHLIQLFYISICSYYHPPPPHTQLFLIQFFTPQKMVPFSTQSNKPKTQSSHSPIHKCIGKSYLISLLNTPDLAFSHYLHSLSPRQHIFTSGLYIGAMASEGVSQLPLRPSNQQSILFPSSQSVKIYK